ncbi:hypothetical protein IAD21_03803 [Abditibacteriota bacterium]|nr:hypothetical protein IAD21_03803 [Abditibacteriota bacterium]
MSPEWLERHLWQAELAQNAYATPDEWDVHTSTPTKQLFWQNGDQVDGIPPTTVTVKASDSQISNSGSVDGKIQINWHRPPQRIFDIRILPVEWQVVPPEEQQGENVGNYIYTALSDDVLLSKIGKEAVVQAMWIVGTEAGAPVVRVLFTRAVSARFVSKLFSDAGIESFVDATAAQIQAIGSRTGIFTVRATEIGERGVAVELTTTRRLVTLGTEGPRPQIHAQGETHSHLQSGDGTIDTVGEAVPEPDMAQGDAREQVVPPDEEVNWEAERAKGKPNNCFVAGTPILMGDGSLKPIEQIQAGDEVESKDPVTGRIQIKKVVRTFRNLAPVILSLTLGNGERLTTTPGHPFATSSHGDFVLAGRLPLKAQLQEFDGHTIPLASENSWAQTTPIYNFEVQDFHTYFVGKSHIWVHNQSRLSQFNEFIQNAVADARNLLKDLPPFGYDNNFHTIGRTESMGPTELSIESGYSGGGPMGGNALAKNARDRAISINNHFKASPKDPPWPNGDGVGIWQASHTEPKLYEREILAGRDGQSPMAVNNDMCPDCQDYFRHLAHVEGKTLTVADKTGIVRVFREDGSVLEIYSNDVVKPSLPPLPPVLPEP